MLNEVKATVADVLQVHAQAEDWTAETPLLGSIPEFDSMAIVAVLTAFEDAYGFFVEDDEVSADTFATLGTLCQFVEQKLAE
ncbi:MAG: phosphopantetheine-binding protein [Woeseiaceae bacterium]|nr:phosphopantetheine-binding protein [Woeseiaceae bacterium]